MKERFELGRCVVTSGVLRAIRNETGPCRGFEGLVLHPLLDRHASGGWGEVSPEDAAENELSVKEGYRIVSSYKLRGGTPVWVITEADRSATTILLPEEY